MSLNTGEGLRPGRFCRGRRWHVVALVGVASLLAVACGSDDIESSPESSAGELPAPSTEVPLTTVPEAATTPREAPGASSSVPSPPLEVVITTSVLAAAVEPLLDGIAEVTVLMPNGSDPHDFSPSARDAERITRADLVIQNGLGLEEGLVDLIDSRQGPTFAVTAHVDLLAITEDKLDDADAHDHGDEGAHDHGDEDAHEHGDDEAHDHGSEDPHVWVDPLVMSQMVDDLGAQLEQLTGVSLGDRVEQLRADLESLDARLRVVMEPVAPCLLVTGHDSLSYFAARYGCEVIGAIIPSLSSTAEASAGELADLRALAQQVGVAAIFTELGTPSRVAEQIASEVGVPLIELATHLVPDEGGYDQFMLDLATTVAEALS